MSHYERHECATVTGRSYTIHSEFVSFFCQSVMQNQTNQEDFDKTSQGAARGTGTSKFISMNYIIVAALNNAQTPC